MTEPIPVIPLEYASQPGSTEAARRLRWWVLAGWLACATATVLIAWVDVETVLITGPVIFLLGAWLLVRGLGLRSPGHAILGSAHCAICLLFFMFVQLFHWSPNRSFQPFLVMGVLYTALSGLASASLILRAQTRR
jgi:hypothetical protein